MMTLAQAGDSREYEHLLREIGAFVKAVVKRNLNDSCQIDDLSQDVLMAVHRARHTFESSRAFLPWLHAIIRFRLTDQLRKVYKAKHFEELDLDRDYHETIYEPPANEELDLSLRSALQHLPEKQRIVVQLLKLEGLSIKEATSRTGMTESALKVSAHRAYKAMRVWLLKNGDRDRDSDREGGDDAE